MQAGNIVRVRTDKDVHFTGTLAQHAIAMINLAAPYLPEALAAGRHCRARLRQIRILSVENLAWEIWLFGTSRFHDLDLDLNRFLGTWAFAATAGVRIASAGPYYYYLESLDVAYEDLDLSGAIHLGLLNRSAASKSANAAGAMVVELGFEGTLGF